VEWNDDGWTDQAWEALFDSEPFSNIKSSRKPDKEREDMINLQRNQTPTETSAHRGVQFLKPSHVPVVSGKIGTLKAKIYKVTTDKPDGFGNPVTVYYNVDGQKYSKGYKFTSDNLADHCDLLTPDETKWIGKSITISKKIGDDGEERLIFSK
jgi:hypothetical protein